MKNLRDYVIEDLHGDTERFPHLTSGDKEASVLLREFLATAALVPGGQEQTWLDYWYDLLRKCERRGWYGEAMPTGVERDERPPWYRFRKDDSRMCYVPEGKFFFGYSPQDDEALPCDFPGKDVDVDHGFYLDCHPITIGRYREFLHDPCYRACIACAVESGDTENSLPLWQQRKLNFVRVGNAEKKTFTSVSELIDILATGPRWPESYGLATWELTPEHPMIGVSWFEALAYSMWSGKALPDERHWEKAARGGYRLAQWQGQHCDFIDNPLPQRKYTWGEQWPHDKVINSASLWRAHTYSVKEWQDGFKKEQMWKDTTMTTPVHDPRFDDAVSPYRAKDMLGNVWEWCSNWYVGQDAQGRKVAPRTFRSCRGGSWYCPRCYSRVSGRGRDHPARRDDDLGFRVVLFAGVFPPLESEI